MESSSHTRIWTKNLVPSTEKDANNTYRSWIHSHLLLPSDSVHQECHKPWPANVNLVSRLRQQISIHWKRSQVDQSSLIERISKNMNGHGDALTPWERIVESVIDEHIQQEAAILMKHSWVEHISRLQRISLPRGQWYHWLAEKDHASRSAFWLLYLRASSVQ